MDSPMRGTMGALSDRRPHVYLSEIDEVNNMDILSRLETVEIQITDRFPPEDMEYCRREEQFYQEAFHIYSETAFIEEETNARLALISPDSYCFPSIKENKDKIYDCSESFISRICGYFRKKYTVTVDDPEWKICEEDSYHRYKTERYDMVPLQYILDSVYEQMGGMSFEEKSFAELTSTARKAVTTYNGKSLYVLKGAKLIIEDFFRSYKDNIFERYKARIEERHRAFFKSLSHYEYGTYDISQKYQFICGQWEIDERDGVYDKHLISSSVIESIKIFKNGKMEIVFRSCRKAAEFMRTYFRGLPQKDAA